MTAAQLVTPTSSQLAAVNAIQAAVTSSLNWAVNTTGTTSAGAKYIEIKPSNVNSLYKDYRILIVEKVTYANNRTLLPGSNTAQGFGTNTNIYLYFAPDGGATGVTFTPANIETASSVYVGTKYLASSFPSYTWQCITGGWTALWLYECDGAIWFINRSAGTSHQIVGLGNIAVSARASHKDFNASGTEWGLAGQFNKAALASATLSNMFSNANFFYWYDTNNSGTKSFTASAITLSGTAPVVTTAAITNSANAGSYYEPVNALAGIFIPINFYTTASVFTTGAPAILRGMYWTTLLKTRTTIQTGSPATTIGYTWYPDDSLTPTALVLAFMNTP